MYKPFLFFLLLITMVILPTNVFGFNQIDDKITHVNEIKKDQIEGDHARRGLDANTVVGGFTGEGREPIEAAARHVQGNLGHALFCLGK